MSAGVGLIGAGVMGSEHARLLARDIPGAHLAGVFDADAARAEAASGGAEVFSSPRALIGSDRIDAVIIASPDADACGADPRLPRGGQAGPLREAVGVLGGGSSSCGRSGSRGEPQADPGRLHAPI